MVVPYGECKFFVIESFLFKVRVVSSIKFHKKINLDSIAPLPAKEGAGGRSIKKEPHDLVCKGCGSSESVREERAFHHGPEDLSVNLLVIIFRQTPWPKYLLSKIRYFVKE